jgi:hypothetical protein
LSRGLVAHGGTNEETRAREEVGVRKKNAMRVGLRDRMRRVSDSMVSGDCCGGLAGLLYGVGW